jgi:hypothetical protein
MTTRYAHAALFFLSVLLSSLMACKKDTVVHGKVVDKVTGEGVSGVRVEWIEYEELNKPPFWYQKEHSVTSDGNGEFQLFSEDLSITITALKSTGHLSKTFGFPKIKKGKVNSTNIEMIPIDGVLLLSFNNASQNDTIYLAIYSPLLAIELPLSSGFSVNRKIYVKNMSSMQYSPLPLASEQTVNIYWSLTPWPTTSAISLSPNSGSVYITRGDTTHFQISI